MEMPGADFLGGLSAGLQSYVKFGIGVSGSIEEPQAARALCDFLTSSACTAFKARGMERD